MVKIKAQVLSFVLYAGVPTSLMLWYANKYSPTEEEIISKLKPTSSYQRTDQAETTKNMQVFFNKMKAQDDKQNKAFEDLLKQGKVTEIDRKKDNASKDND